jgi:hypothetical protein
MSARRRKQIDDVLNSYRLKTKKELQESWRVMGVAARTNSIWTISPDKLYGIIANNDTFAGVLRDIGIDHKKVRRGYYYNVIKRRIEEENIDISHFRYRRNKQEKTNSSLKV